MDDTIEDIQEGVATYEEIQNAITNPLGTQLHDEVRAGLGRELAC